MLTNKSNKMEMEMVSFRLSLVSLKEHTYQALNKCFYEHVEVDVKREREKD